jgi:hypothetical protein
MFGLACILIFAGSRALSKSDNVGFLLVVFGLVFLAMTVLIVRHYAKILNTIEVALDGIEIRGLIKRKRIRWNDVHALNLTGKQSERFMFTSMPMEALTIFIKNGTKEIIFGKHYSNFDRLRTALHFINLKIEKNETITPDCFIQVERERPLISELINSRKFGGNHLLTFNGILSYGSIAFALWLLIFSNNHMPVTATLISLSLILLFGPGLHGYQLHYFKINEEYLLVRNHLWFWRNEAYLIKDIREIVFEEPYKMSTSLRVITNNYESKLYPAGSIRQKSWRKLSEELRAYGVNVRNEAYFE